MSRTTPHFQWSGDLLAGITGAAAGIPQSMAFALIAGLNPIHGLAAAFIGTVVGTLTGGSVFLTISTTNALALAVGSVLASGQGNTLQSLVTLTYLVGVVQLVAGILRLGGFTRYVSHAVMTGFISGAALLIVLGQLPALLGYRSLTGQGILIRSADLLVHFRQTHLPTFLVGLLSIGVISGLSKTRLRSFSLLLALIITTLFVQMVRLDGIALVGDVVSIPRGLPVPMLPQIQEVLYLLPSAVAIAILGLVQSAGISRGVSPSGLQSPAISRDFIGQGLANIASGFFQGLPVGGSISRTAVNVASGARSRLANLVAGMLVGAALFSAGKLVEYIPLSTLAGLLIVAAVRLVNIEHIRQVSASYLPGLTTMIVTFAATLILPLEYSIYAGVVLSVLLYLHTSSQHVTICQLVPKGNGDFWEAAAPPFVPASHPLILEIHGSLFFGAVYTLEKQLPRLNGVRSPVVILRLRGQSPMGNTFIQMVERYAREIQRSEGRFMLAGVSPSALEQFRRTGMLDILGYDNVFVSDDTLLQSTRLAYQRGQTWMRPNKTDQKA